MPVSGTTLRSVWRPTMRPATSGTSTGARFRRTLRRSHPSDATSANNGTYSATAINAAGLTSTNTVTLNVVTSTTLTITSQPASVSVYATQTATFSVGATGTGTLAYQWYTDTPGRPGGTLINGATSSSYTTPALTTANNEITYYVTVSDPDCTGNTLTSNAATHGVGYGYGRAAHD